MAQLKDGHTDGSFVKQFNNKVSERLKILFYYFFAAKEEEFDRLSGQYSGNN